VKKLFLFDAKNWLFGGMRLPPKVCFSANRMKFNGSNVRGRGGVVFGKNQDFQIGCF
jgi:hypothetical protein